MEASSLLGKSWKVPWMSKCPLQGAGRKGHPSQENSVYKGKTWSLEKV